MQRIQSDEMFLAISGADNSIRITISHTHTYIHTYVRTYTHVYMSINIPKCCIHVTTNFMCTQKYLQTPSGGEAGQRRPARPAAKTHTSLSPRCLLASASPCSSPSRIPSGRPRSPGADTRALPGEAAASPQRRVRRPLGDAATTGSAWAGASSQWVCGHNMAAGGGSGGGGGAARRRVTVGRASLPLVLPLVSPSPIHPRGLTRRCFWEGGEGEDVVAIYDIIFIHTSVVLCPFHAKIQIPQRGQLVLP